jgi:hypothetical protein
MWQAMQLPRERSMAIALPSSASPLRSSSGISTSAIATPARARKAAAMPVVALRFSMMYLLRI